MLVCSRLRACSSALIASISRNVEFCTQTQTLLEGWRGEGRSTGDGDDGGWKIGWGREWWEWWEVCPDDCGQRACFAI